MRLRHLLSGRRIFARSAGSPNPPQTNPRFPGLEPLEPRLLLSGTAYVIDSLLDTVAADGHLTLREAILAANANIPVNEAPAGTREETDSITFAASLFSSGHADLILSGTELAITGDLSITGPGQELLSIDADQKSRVFNISGSGTDVAMDGLTVRNGYVSGNGNNNGAGLSVRDSNLTLTNCTVSDNTLASQNGCGGGLFVYGTATLTSCTFSGNASTGEYGTGGGLYVYYGTATLADCLVAWNLASISGGLHVYYGTATLTNCTISANSAQYYGGGLYVYDGTATLTNCTISGNSAQYSGGGLYVIGTVTLANCTVSGNSANFGGGLYLEYYSTATLTNCAISGNSANSDIYSLGGGLYGNYDSTATLTNCTVSGNSADSSGGGLHVVGTATLTNCAINGNSANSDIYSHGGGLYVNYDSTATLTNCTISENSAQYCGGGAYINGTVTLTNCTISGNSADSSGGGLGVPDGTTTLNNTIVAANAANTEPDVHGSYTASSSFIGGDPQFIRNPSAGLDGLWGTPDDDLGDLHLRVDSPCVNAGDNSLAVDANGDPLTIDLDSHPRIAGTQVDIGAYELGGIPGDFTGDWSITLSDIEPFKLALTDTPAWQAQFPGVPLWAIDPNGDGTITLSDINAFKNLLTGSAASGQALSLTSQNQGLSIDEPRASASGASISSTPLRSWLVEAQSPPPSADSSWRSAQPTKKSLFAHRRSIFGDVDASITQPPAPVEAGVLADLPAVAVA
ncbi:MAG: right-handed parallel beta-helix repeat-containing protein [Phycisphaeraceae bacterium]|nr:right-handed parallel beta-helix repeat-containing protein [Phycisphaeraceae bacterium]